MTILIYDLSRTKVRAALLLQRFYYRSAAAVLTRLKGTPTTTAPAPTPPAPALSPLSGLFSTGPVVSRF